MKSFHIVPFIYDGDKYESVVEKYSNKDLQGNLVKLNGWQLKDTSAQQLFYNIENLISSKNDNGRIGIMLERDLKDSVVTINNKTVKVLKTSEGNFKFSYKNIKLFLFETGIGFLCLEIEFFKSTDIVLGNYYFKKFNHSHIEEDYDFEDEDFIDKLQNEIIQFETKGNIKASESKKKILLKISEKLKRNEMISKIIEESGVECTSFFTNKSDADYGHVFTYVDVDNNKSLDDINNMLYYLKNSYKPSYKPTKNDLDSNIQLYENVWWGMSIEALCCVAQYTENEKTDKFIKSTLGSEKIERIYLYIYIIMLHMRYALLNYIIQASSLPRRFKDYEKENVDTLNKLKEKIIMLDLRCIFNDVSNISAHIKIFDMMRNVLRIDKLESEISNEIDKFTKIIQIHNEKKGNELKEEQRMKNEAIQNYIQIVTFSFAVFAFGSAIKDVTDSIINIVYGNYEQTKFYFSVPISIITLGIILFGKLVVIRKNDKRK